MNRNKVYLKLYFPLSHHWAVLYREHFLSPLLVTSRGLLPQPRMGGSGCWISKGDVADANAWIIMAWALFHSFALWHLEDDACEFTLLHVLFLSSLIPIFSLGQFWLSPNTVPQVPNFHTQMVLCLFIGTACLLGQFIFQQAHAYW